MSVDNGLFLFLAMAPRAVAAGVSDTTYTNRMEPARVAAYSKSIPVKPLRRPLIPKCCAMKLIAIKTSKWARYMKYDCADSQSKPLNSAYDLSLRSRKTEYIKMNVVIQ